MTKRQSSKPDLLSKLMAQPPIRTGPISFIDRIPQDIRGELAAIATRWRRGELNRSAKQVCDVFVEAMKERGIEVKISPSHFTKILHDLAQ